MVLYALLSLTVVRMLPTYLSLVGTQHTLSERLFVGWFGPRGLASIVFAIIVLNSGIPVAPFVTSVVACTVLFSLILHGISVVPLANWFARQNR